MVSPTTRASYSKSSTTNGSRLGSRIGLLFLSGRMG
jgi:hypothetical protein